MRQKIVAGNWKMNTTLKSGTDLASALAGKWTQDSDAVEVVICPPFPYLAAIGGVIGNSQIVLGAQNCYFEAPGAFTGEIAPEMLLDVGCKYVILGHSERRTLLGETDAVVNKKVHAALGKGLPVILCVGELLAERQSEQTEQVLDTQMTGSLANVTPEQMASIVVAYEPVWAIGTGLTATPEQAEAAHLFLRQWAARRFGAGVAESLQILYGGSVKPDNAEQLLRQPNVDGALVGGASLKVEQFWPIIEAAQRVG